MQGEFIMKNAIYYFSGTGNSLWIAQKINEKLEDSKLISIPSFIDQAENINGKVIGIICPIYMYNIPHIVVDFIKKIKSVEYLFIVFTGAGQLGSGIKKTFKVFASQGIKLNSLFNIPMPSNYTPYGCPTEDKQKELFAAANEKVEKIIEVVKKRGAFIDSSNSTFFQSYIHPGLLYKMGYARINIMDNSFFSDDKCNGCSICQKVCPVNNITMINNKPKWNNQCQQCYACLQWCPQTAIRSNKKTADIKRYHHPNITVKAIINSSPVE
ncbi:MAG: hypothetical protein DRI23_06065 [Candidatus Cloacimonadota bacterium]|nr:MAG: hypothetical protein DRI23_06065 [Candidatus Cloacimonadota bacterium]